MSYEDFAKNQAIKEMRERPVPDANGWIPIERLEDFEWGMGDEILVPATYGPSFVLTFGMPSGRWYNSDGCDTNPIEEGYTHFQRIRPPIDELAEYRAMGNGELLSSLLGTRMALVANLFSCHPTVELETLVLERMEASNGKAE